MNSSLWKEAFVIMTFCVAMPTVDVYGDLSLAYFHLSYKDCGKKSILKTNLFIFTKICAYSCFISLFISNLTDTQLWSLEHRGSSILNGDYYFILNRKGDWKYEGPDSFSLCSYL